MLQGASIYHLTMIHLTVTATRYVHQQKGLEMYSQRSCLCFSKALRENYPHSAHAPLISSSEVAEVGTINDLENFRVEFLHVQLSFNIFMDNSNTKYFC